MLLDMADTQKMLHRCESRWVDSSLAPSEKGPRSAGAKIAN
ncbi:unnamed protein product [Ixodes pacificus]